MQRKASKSELQLLGARVVLWSLVLVFATLIGCVFLVPPAQAAEPQPRVVNEMVSEPGETHEQFVQRVAVFLNGWTYYNSVEACGVLARNSHGFSVVIGTLDSQVHCDSVLYLAGYQATGETIHSHPMPDAAGRLVISDRTRLLTGDLLDGRRFVEVQRKQFSADDYRAGPGYLVTDGVLLHQRGVGTRQLVAMLPDVPR